MFSTTTPLQVRNNPSNKSTSKHHWSFSKAPRFSNPRPKYFLINMSVAASPATKKKLVYQVGPLLSVMDAKPNVLMAKQMSLSLENIP